MTTLLHIDLSIQGERSVTRELTKAIVADLRSKRPDLQVHYLNLATRPLTHLVLDQLPPDHPLAGAGVGGPDDPHSRLAGEEALDEFLAADVVVIGAPMYAGSRFRRSSRPGSTAFSYPGGPSATVQPVPRA